MHRLLSATLRMGIRSIMLFLGGVIFCLILSPRLSLVLLALVIPLVLVVRTVFRKAVPLFRRVQQKIDDMVQVIRENIRGIKVSKALDKTEYEQGRFAVANEEVQTAEIEAIDQIAKMSPSVNLILFSGVALVSVSYTHLDVYKRQPIKISRSACISSKASTGMSQDLASV